jgi:hypothetical protein
LVILFGLFLAGFGYPALHGIFKLFLAGFVYPALHGIFKLFLAGFGSPIRALLSRVWFSCSGSS